MGKHTKPETLRVCLPCYDIHDSLVPVTEDYSFGESHPCGNSYMWRCEKGHISVWAKTVELGLDKPT